MEFQGGQGRTRPPGQGKDIRGEGGNFLQGPTSFPQAPSYFKHSQKDVEGGVPRKKDEGPPPWISFKKGSYLILPWPV